MNIFVLAHYVRQNLDADQVAAIMRLVTSMVILGLCALFILLSMSGATKFSGRSMTLIDPSYAKNHMPLIASVSEHAPSVWDSYFRDLGLLIIFVPVGFYYCLVHKVTHGKLFIAMYGVFASYFSSVMIRLMLVLAPAACVLSGIAVSHLVGKSTKVIRLFLIGLKPETDESKKDLRPAHINKSVNKRRMPVDIALVVLGLTLALARTNILHSTSHSAQSFSSPSFIMDYGSGDNRMIVDDFREAYYWLKQNTAKDDKILSWWDYGYQITGMSNRTVIVDNNTWNNTHIATVAKVLISDEKEAHKIAR
jgi:dolichyl-diphosphooligosaccharide--protein glycosyltransferase